MSWSVPEYSAEYSGLLQLEPDPDKRLKYLDFVKIYSHLSDSECEGYQRDYPDEAIAMQSYSARIRQEGEQLGKRIGIQLGEANMLLFQLEQRFGMVPAQDPAGTTV